MIEEIPKIAYKQTIDWDVALIVYQTDSSQLQTRSKRNGLSWVEDACKTRCEKKMISERLMMF